MQIRPLFPISDSTSEPDVDARAKALRQEELRCLLDEAHRACLDSHRALVAHRAASERMALAILEARARLARAREQLDGGA